MPVKRFIAADMRRALAMVREELGDDAMIMSTQRTKKGVELIASADEGTTELETTVNQQAQLATQPVKTNANKLRSHHVRLSPRIEPQLNQKIPAESLSQVGLASGKTHEELANEIEQAREKMLSSKRQESMTIGDWAEQKKSRVASVESPPEHSKKSLDQLALMDDKTISQIEKRVDQMVQKTTKNQQAVSQKTDRDIRELQNEILSMRSSFSEQLSAMAEMQSQHFNEARAYRETLPMAQTVKQRLSALGLTQTCSDNILKSLKSIDSQSISAEGLWKESLARLSHRINTLNNDVVSQGGVFAFWGPTGVGKTTTIAKLAARYVIENDRRDVVLLSTDRIRIAAHDQLKSLGQILNIQVDIIDDLKNLPKRLKALSQNALVLIDTPGISRQDELFKEHLAAMRCCEHIHHTLVLSANSQYQMLQACVHSYRLLGIESCVLTKLDECASLGDGLSVLAVNKLPLSYITDGQRVPEDIATIRSHQLVTKAVTLSKRYAQQNTKATGAGILEPV